MNASPMGSVDKALIVLDYLAGLGPEGASLAQISEHAAVSKSTIHRTLAALKFRDYVWQHPERGTYRLGRAALTLADGFSSEAGLTELLHPVLEAVKDHFDELCQLGVLEGTDVVYLAKVEPLHPIRVWSEVGRRLPAKKTALGRSLIAAHVYAQSHGYDSAQSNDSAAGPLVTQINEMRSSAPVQYALEHGFAMEAGDSEPGVGCVAVPIMQAHRPVGAISITMPESRFTDPPALGKSLRMMVAQLLPAPFAVGL